MITGRNTRPYCRLIGVILLIGMMSGPVHAAEPAARVQFVAGEVFATSEDRGTRKLSKGDAIYSGDTLESADASSAQILFTDNGRIAVRANTRLIIREYRYDADNPAASNVLVNLLEGAIRSITGLIGQFHREGVVLQTPIANVGIRGTDHETIHITPEFDRANASDLAGTYDKVYSGATELRSSSGTLLLNPNQVGFVAGQPGSIGAPGRIDALPGAVQDLLAVRILQNSEAGVAAVGTERDSQSETERTIVKEISTPGQEISSSRNQGAQGELRRNPLDAARGLGNLDRLGSPPGLGNTPGPGRGNGPPITPPGLSGPDKGPNGSNSGTDSGNGNPNPGNGNPNPGNGNPNPGNGNPNPGNGNPNPGNGNPNPGNGNPDPGGGNG